MVLRGLSLRCCDFNITLGILKVKLDKHVVYIKEIAVFEALYNKCFQKLRMILETCIITVYKIKGQKEAIGGQINKNLGEYAIMRTNRIINKGKLYGKVHIFI